MIDLYDNIKNKFLDGLRSIINTSVTKSIDICVGYFNLRGWSAIVKEIDDLSARVSEKTNGEKHCVCRLLIGMYRAPQEYISKMYSCSFSKDVRMDNREKKECIRQIALDFRNQLVKGVPTKNDEKALRHLAAQLKEGKVEVKLYLDEPLHAKLYIANREDNVKYNALMGSSNLTYSGVTGQGELDILLTDTKIPEELSEWFNNRWEKAKDISQELINVIDESWAREKPIPPYHIYLKTAFLLSQDARAGIAELSIPEEFENELFDFQKTAVQIAVRHLRNKKRGGAMIGDVVGLGKTITACAIAKIYETNFAGNTLIICPANLQEMWKHYRDKYALKAEIISMANPDVPNDSRIFRLIIIDESHNLRNGATGKRYNDIKTIIEKQSDCNVLLLTATPYNKKISDLVNQLKLFISEDQDLGIRPEKYIKEKSKEEGGIDKSVSLSTINAFEKSEYPEDCNELLKLFLIRRTRTFIKQNYAKTDETDGRKYLLFNDNSRSYFPERIPKALKFNTVQGDQYSRFYSEEMIEMMNSLNLPRYGLGAYTKEDEDNKLVNNLKHAKKRMMGFCRSTFFKRMDSSGFSFLLTLYRHILRNMVFVYALENKLKLPIADENSLPDEYVEDDDRNAIFLNGADVNQSDVAIKFPTDLDFYRQEAKKYYDIINGRKNVEWLEYKCVKSDLKKDLLSDCNTLVNMINLCGDWQPSQDKKLEQLENLLRNTHANEKVLIFTQYSDTAHYIYHQLDKRGIKKIGLVTGDTEDPTSFVKFFSPRSNGANVTPEDELRILVATDVLSEGQNLQDAHIIINYDLPWAIIRLIQRAGRVDRIGQQENKVFCYSFFPADGVESVINLRKRLNERINENAETIGSDEVFFEDNEQNLRDMFNEKSGILDDDKCDDDDDVDLASQAYQIWKNATEARPELEKIIPAISNIAYSTKSVANSQEQGVITYARTANGNDALIWLAPDGSVISQSQKRILNALSCSADTPPLQPLPEHHELVKKAVVDISKLSKKINPAGALGKKRSPRRLLFERLSKICEDKLFDNSFSQDTKDELKQVMDTIFKHTLLSSSEKHFKKIDDMADEKVVEKVLELYRAEELCHTEEDNGNKELQIICSMGMAYIHNENA